VVRAWREDGKLKLNCSEEGWSQGAVAASFSIYTFEYIFEEILGLSQRLSNNQSYLRNLLSSPYNLIWEFFQSSLPLTQPPFVLRKS